MNTNPFDSEDFVSLDRILDFIVNAIDRPPHWPKGELNRELNEAYGDDMAPVITPPGVLKRPTLITEAVMLLLRAINRDVRRDNPSPLVWKEQRLAQRYVHDDEKGEVRDQAIRLLNVAGDSETDAMDLFLRYRDRLYDDAGRAIDICELPRDFPWEHYSDRSAANIIGLNKGDLYKFLDDHRIPYQTVPGPVPFPLINEEIGSLFGSKAVVSRISADKPQTWDIQKWKDVLSYSGTTAWLRPARVPSDDPKCGTPGGHSALYNPVRLAYQLYQTKKVPIEYLDDVFKKPELAGWLPFWEPERTKIATIERGRVVTSKPKQSRAQSKLRRNPDYEFGHETDDQFSDPTDSKSGGKTRKVTGLGWHAPKTPRKS